MTQITLRQIEIFVQTVEYKSFHRCAEAIGVSQVAISEHIKSLETNLDYKLFTRPPGEAAKLTPEGEKAYQHALTILAEVQAMNWESVKNPRLAMKVQIRLCMHGYIYDGIHNEIDRFLDDHPNVELSLQMAPQRLSDMENGLDEGTIDLVYFFAIDNPGLFKSEFVSYEPLDIFVCEQHELAQQKVSGKQLQSYKAVRLTTDNYLRDTIEEAMIRVGIESADSAVETEEYGLILSTVKRGEAFACMFSKAVENTSEHLAALDLYPSVPDAQIRCAVSDKGAHHPLVLELKKRLSGEIQRQTREQ